MSANTSIKMHMYFVAFIKSVEIKFTHAILCKIDSTAYEWKSMSISKREFTRLPPHLQHWNRQFCAIIMDYFTSTILIYLQWIAFYREMIVHQSSHLGIFIQWWLNTIIYMHKIKTTCFIYNFQISNLFIILIHKRETERVSE